jgi:hypothetical protein
MNRSIDCHGKPRVYKAAYLIFTVGSKDVRSNRLILRWLEGEGRATTTLRRQGKRKKGNSNFEVAGKKGDYNFKAAGKEEEGRLQLRNGREREGRVTITSRRQGKKDDYNFEVVRKEKEGRLQL